MRLRPGLRRAKELSRELSQAVERHEGNLGHHRRVGFLVATVAEALDLPDPALLGEAAELHDLGKLAIPANVLCKPGPLSAAERKLIDAHPRAGYDRLMQLARATRNAAQEYWQIAATIALRHHERYDGRGYPDGLAGEGIPLVARIVHACDVYDALTSQRAYHEALSPTLAIRELTADAESFDPEVLRILLDVGVPASLSLTSAD